MFRDLATALTGMQRVGNATRFGATMPKQAIRTAYGPGSTAYRMSCLCGSTYPRIKPAQGATEPVKKFNCTVACYRNLHRTLRCTGNSLIGLPGGGGTKEQPTRLAVNRQASRLIPGNAC